MNESFTDRWTELLRKEADLEASRAAMRRDAVEEVKALMENFHIMPHEIGLRDAEVRVVKTSSRNVKRLRKRYRSPFDPDVVWQAAGPRPAWLARALDAGYTLDDMLVKE